MLNMSVFLYTKRKNINILLLRGQTPQEEIFIVEHVVCVG